MGVQGHRFYDAQEQGLCHTVQVWHRCRNNELQRLQDHRRLRRSAHKASLPRQHGISKTLQHEYHELQVQLGSRQQTDLNRARVAEEN